MRKRKQCDEYYASSLFTSLAHLSWFLMKPSAASNCLKPRN